MRILALALCLVASTVLAADRCADFKDEVRKASWKYLGVQAPWWYLLGQLKQESGCRADIISFDGGEGIAQFMPVTREYVSKVKGYPIDPFNPASAIDGQTFYMKMLDEQNRAPGKPLWVSFAFYNSGAGTLNKEARREGEQCAECHELWAYAQMKKICLRKKLVLKGGKILDLCDVGYDYPVRIHKYGELFRQGVDGRRFW